MSNNCKFENLLHQLFRQIKIHLKLNKQKKELQNGQKNMKF